MLCRLGASQHILSRSSSPEIGLWQEGYPEQKYLGVHGQAYSRFHLFGCCRPASGHTVRGVSERGPVINQGPHHIQNWASIKKVWVFVPRFFMFFFQPFSSGFFLVFDPRDRREAWHEMEGWECL